MDTLSFAKSMNTTGNGTTPPQGNDNSVGKWIAIGLAVVAAEEGIRQGIRAGGAWIKQQIKKKGKNTATEKEITENKEQKTNPNTQNSEKRVLPNALDLQHTVTSSSPFLLPHFIQIDEFSSIYGAEGLGKSFVATQLCIDATLGRRSSFFPDEESIVPRCHTIYYASEGQRDRIWERFPDGFLEGNKSTCAVLPVDSFEIEEIIEDLGERIDSIPAGERVLIIIDNLTSITKNNPRTKIADHLIQNIVNVKTKAETRGLVLGVILFTHTNTDGTKAKASGFLRQTITTEICFSGEAKTPNRTLTIVKNNRNRFGEECHFTLISDSDKRCHFETRTNNSSSSDSIIKPLKEAKTDVRCKLSNEEIEDIIKRKKSGERIEDLAREKGTSMKTLYKWIKKYSEEHKEK